MISRKSPLEINALLENNPARITVQRITVVINRRKNTCALEGVWAAAAASDMRAQGSKCDNNCKPAIEPKSERGRLVREFLAVPGSAGILSAIPQPNAGKLPALLT